MSYILIPIKDSWEGNSEFADQPNCQEILSATLDFYKVIGYRLPWVGYFVKRDDALVGGGGFKGQPINNRIEIAYHTFPEYQNQGIGKMICEELVKLALATQPGVIITARTLPEHSYSTKILVHNSFECMGIVYDADDGNVWEWEYRKAKSQLL